MTRLLRWAFNFATIISAVVFTAVILLWLRSYWRDTGFNYVTYDGAGYIAVPPPTSSFSLTISRGGLWYRCWEPPPTDVPSHPLKAVWSVYSYEPVCGKPPYSYLPGSPDNPDTWRLGFAYGYISSMYDDRALRLPMWLPAIVFALLPGIAGWAFARRFRRRENGLCTFCGYDLRASPGRCPECGQFPVFHGPSTRPTIAG
jgi:hypothetical protein